MSFAPPPPLSARLMARFLDGVERVGNALPQPATLFALLAIAVVLLSGWLAHLGVSAVMPGSGESVQAVSLLNLVGLHSLVSGAVGVFVNFPPLGAVVVALIGFAVAEASGLISALVRLIVLSSPRRLLTPLVVLAGVLSNAGGDVGYVVLIPLAASLFHAVGRHPLAGLAAGFAGVSGGFSANLIIGVVDVALAGLTESAARLVSPEATVTGLANYYFMAVSTFVVTFVGTWVTHRVVEPRLGTYEGNVPPTPLESLRPEERRGLWCSLGFLLAFAAVLLAGVVPETGFLRSPGSSSMLDSLLFQHLVPFLFLFGLGTGLTYGLAAGTVKSDKTVARAMESGVASLAGYLVIAFFAAQFIACFSQTKLGLIMAIKGAESIRALGLETMPIPLMIALILLSAVINLVIGSASAKWALLAPIFVPMFMLLGYSPELVQAAYRVGDSSTNIITPLMTYFPLILTFAQRYSPRAGIGTLAASMLPYSFAFLLGWSCLLIFWITLRLPTGPGAPLFPVG